MLTFTKTSSHNILLFPSLPSRTEERGGKGKRREGKRDGKIRELAE